MIERPRLLIQLPRLLGYRRAEFEKLVPHFDLAIAYSPDKAGEGFDIKAEAFISNADFIQVEEKVYFGGRLFWQRGFVRAIRFVKPDIVFVQANVRYISFWLALIYCRIKGIPFASHGQGLYRYPDPSVAKRLLYRLHASLATTYVCYNEISQASMIGAGVPERRLSVARNSLVNSCPSPPEFKLGGERGVLFIGRLRARSGLEELIEAIDDARVKSGVGIELHVIGGGDGLPLLAKKCQEVQWVHLYGSIYDDAEIARIASDCFMGVYPGDAGLSVVHMMSLSLPPAVHSTIHAHMGPEPGYVLPGVNGFFFDRNEVVTSLTHLLSKLVRDRDLIRKAQVNAYRTYRELTNPSFGDQLVGVLQRLLKER